MYLGGLWMATLHRRILWHGAGRNGIYTAFSPAIRDDSVVVITVAEAALSTP